VLKDFPPSYLALVMATGIVSLAAWAATFLGLLRQLARR